jgi:AcrR family transcriptional regulator
MRCMNDGRAQSRRTTTGARARGRPREERERQVLDVAAELFYARGVHEVGMDELVRATGLGKATVYRLFPTKDALIGAYLDRLAASILTAIDRDVARHAERPRQALDTIFEAIAADVSRPSFRGCPFNNASIEFADPAHPARTAARTYRAALRDRLSLLAERIRPGAGERLGAQLALLIDGLYVNAAHLGAPGTVAAGQALMATIVGEADD